MQTHHDVLISFILQFISEKFRFRFTKRVLGILKNNSFPRPPHNKQYNKMSLNIVAISELEQNR